MPVVNSVLPLSVTLPLALPRLLSLPTLTVVSLIVRPPLNPVLLPVILAVMDELAEPPVLMRPSDAPKARVVVAIEAPELRTRLPGSPRPSPMVRVKGPVIVCPSLCRAVQKRF